MSLEAVNQFLEKVAADTQIQEELATAMSAENDRQAVVELGNKYGFQFSGEELMQEIQKRQQTAADAGELNDEELESVAGGVFTVLSQNATVTITATGKIPKPKW